MKNIIFMGTPDFATPALQALIDSDHNILAVYSQPPRAAGRGKKLRESAVHKLAEANNITVHNPTSLRNDMSVAEYKPDFIIVAAYGLLLPQNILDVAPCINIHPSALPRWRGAAPIQRSIMAGDKNTAMCIMQMDIGLDSGDILAKQDVDLPNYITASKLHDDMAKLGANMLLDVIDNYDNIEHQKQVGEPVYAKKISKDEAKIDWNLTATEIDCLVRGLYSYPCAYFEHNGERIKILSGEVVDASGNAGDILDDNLLIACSKQAYRPSILQRAGKKPLQRTEFLRGFTIKNSKLTVI